MKRVSDHQLTKDNADAADAPAGDVADGIPKAAPEVLAARRILKARRTPNLPPPSAAPAANPFAKLAVAQPPAPPVADGGTPPGGREGAPSARASALDGEAPAPQPAAADKPTADKPAVEAAEKQLEAEEPAPDAEPPAEDTAPDASDKPTTEAKASTDDAKEEPAPGAQPNTKAEQPKPAEAAPLPDAAAPPAATPDHVSEPPETAPVAAEAPKAPSPLPTNPPSQAPAKPADAAPADPPAPAADKDTNGAANGVSKPTILFGGKAAPLTFASAAKPDGGFSFQPSAAAPAKPAPKPEFKEARVETGEEDDKEMFRSRAKLYSLETHGDAPRWKERGIGALKLNMNKRSGKVRLLMRTEATLRVVLNTPVFPEFQLDRATERSLRFQGIDLDSEEATTRTSFLVRFATRDVTSELISTIEAWKEEQETTK